jgi:signal peptidase I
MTDKSAAWRERVWRGARSAALVVVVLLAVGAVAAVLSGRYQARPVLTGSMRPGLPVGGVVVTERVPVAALHVRDVIVFHRPDDPSQLVVHRIVSLRHSSGGVVIQTQGDDNPGKDPWKVTLLDSTAYRAQFSVPWVGYLSIWWHQPSTRTIALALAICCGLGAVVSLSWPKPPRRRKPASARRRRRAATGSDPTPGMLRSPPLSSPATAMTTPWRRVRRSSSAEGWPISRTSRPRDEFEGLVSEGGLEPPRPNTGTSTSS